MTLGGRESYCASTGTARRSARSPPRWPRRAQAWSGVRIGCGKPFELLELWLASVLDGCLLSVDRQLGRVDPAHRVACPRWPPPSYTSLRAFSESRVRRPRLGRTRRLAGARRAGAYGTDHRGSLGPRSPSIRRGRGGPEGGPPPRQPRHRPAARRVAVRWLADRSGFTPQQQLRHRALVKLCGERTRRRPWGPVEDRPTPAEHSRGNFSRRAPRPRVRSPGDVAARPAPVRAGGGPGARGSGCTVARPPGGSPARSAAATARRHPDRTGTAGQPSDQWRVSRAARSGPANTACLSQRVGDDRLHHRQRHRTSAHASGTPRCAPPPCPGRRPASPGGSRRRNISANRPAPFRLGHLTSFRCDGGHRPRAKVSMIVDTPRCRRKPRRSNRLGAGGVNTRSGLRR